MSDKRLGLILCIGPLSFRVHGGVSGVNSDVYKTFLCSFCMRQDDLHAVIFCDDITDRETKRFNRETSSVVINAIGVQ